MNDKEYLDLEQEFIVLAIPSRTVEINITAKVWHDGKVVSVGRVMPFEEIRAAFDEAKEGYVPSNAVFVLNEDYGKSKLARLLEKYCSEEGIGES